MRRRSQDARGTYTLETLCARIADVAFLGSALDIGVVETAVCVAARHYCGSSDLRGVSGDRWTVGGENYVES